MSDILATKLTALREQFEQTKAALNQVLGAIAICEQMQKEEADKVAAEKALTEQPEL